MRGSSIVAAILATTLAGRAEPARALDAPPPGDGAAEASLRSMVEAPTQPELAWSDVRAIQGAVRRFYEAGGHQLAWSRAGRPTVQARAAVDALRRAAEVGLDPRDYDGPAWAERLQALEAAPAPGPALARFDVLLTISLCRYVTDLHDGRLLPPSSAKGIGRATLPRPAPGETFDAGGFLRGVVDARDVAGALAAAEPPYPGYRRGVEALRRYLSLQDGDDGEPLPVPRRAVAAGGRYPSTAALAVRLRLRGDLGPGPEPQGDAFDTVLAEAVARFQRRHGLEPSGRLDAPTARALNVPIARRAEQLALTVERWRWVPRRLSAPTLVVNIPEFRLHLADPARPGSMKVVVGQAYVRNRTPVIASELNRVIFQPPWNVPLRIQRDEIVPKLEKDPGYLAAGSYEVREASGRPLPAAPAAELLPGLRSGALRLQQRPGPRNALGRVKFLFPNPYDVYLHDTPSQELFARSRRDFSHGCIRVEQPAELAAWVLRDEPGWTPERIRAALEGTETVAVKVSHPIPIFVLYGTALVTREGEVRFFEDLYGWDRALARALAAEGARRTGSGRGRPVSSPAP